MCSNHDHLTDIIFPDFDNNLIGTDNIDLVTSQATITRTEIAPRAISTPLVWKIGVPTADILVNSVFKPTFLTTTTKPLIGTDNIDLVTSEEKIKGPQNAPRAISTPVGWTIGGPTANTLENSVFRDYSSHHNDTNEDAQLSELLASTWRMETYGTSPEVTLSKDKNHAPETLWQTIIYTD